MERKERERERVNVLQTLASRILDHRNGPFVRMKKSGDGRRRQGALGSGKIYNSKRRNNYRHNGEFYIRGQIIFTVPRGVGEGAYKKVNIYNTVVILKF